MIHIIIGTKAQLIKMAPVMKSLSGRDIPYNYICTGQHKDTMEDIHRNFGIKAPDYTLYDGNDITSVTQMLGWAVKNLVRTLHHKNEIFGRDTNGIVLVHGDTFSTLLGAIMAKAAGLKVAHIESGLRSYNLFHPFPEEITRVLTFKLSDYMFCAGEWAINNLGKFRSKAINTGVNTLYDSLRHAIPAIQNVSDVEIPVDEYGVVTLHRFENIFSRAALNRVISIIERLSRRKKLLFIMHNPTLIKLRKYGFFEELKANPNIELRPRYDYFQFMRLVMNARFLVSDGGSNQEECFYLGKPVLLLRQATERMEGLGRNCVLSRYDDATIDAFINNIGSYQFDFLDCAISPSEIILEHCRRFM